MGSFDCAPGEKNRGSPLGVSLQRRLTAHAQGDENLSDVIVTDSAVDT